MLESAQSSVITKVSSRSVAETVDQLKRFIADRGFTLFRVIDHSGTAKEAGVQMSDSKLVMFGNPTKGAAVMLAAPLAGLDLPLRVLVWEDGNGVVSVSYNSWDSWPSGSTSRVPCGRPSTQLSRSLRQYLVHKPALIRGGHGPATDAAIADRGVPHGAA